MEPMAVSRNIYPYSNNPFRSKSSQFDVDNTNLHDSNQSLCQTVAGSAYEDHDTIELCYSSFPSMRQEEQHIPVPTSNGVWITAANSTERTGKYSISPCFEEEAERLNRGQKMARANIDEQILSESADASSNKTLLDMRKVKDLEVLRQIYREIKQKISRSISTESYQSTRDYKSLNWREVFIAERMKKWLLCIVIGFLIILTIKDIIQLVVEYANNPSHIAINIAYNQTINMPTITFCISPAHALSYFEINKVKATINQRKLAINETLLRINDRQRFLSEAWKPHLILEAYDVVATLTSVEMETSENGLRNSIMRLKSSKSLDAKRKMMKKWLTVLERLNVSFTDLLNKVGGEISENIVHRLQRNLVDINSRTLIFARTTWISTIEFCFQPWSNHEHFNTIDRGGQFLTAIVSHNTVNLLNQTIDCISVDINGRPCSLARFIEELQICIGLRHELNIRVQMYQLLKHKEDSTIACEERNEMNNEFHCHLRCRLQLLRKLCHCNPRSILHILGSREDKISQRYTLCDYEKCELNVVNESEKECSKNCFRNCDQIEYSIEQTTQGRMVNHNLTYVQMNWNSFEYVVLEQKRVWSLPTFIAALGGTVGMWLGLSIFSLIQGGTHLYTYFAGKIVKMRFFREKIRIIKDSG